MFRYGSDAGQFTENVVHTAVGAAAATYCVSNLGIKVVAKRAAADSVIAMASSSSAAVAAGAQHTQMTETSVTNAQMECNSPPTYSMDAAVGNVTPRVNVTPGVNITPGENVTPYDSITPESTAVAVVSSSK